MSGARKYLHKLVNEIPENEFEEVEKASQSSMSFWDNEIFGGIKYEIRKVTGRN